MQTIKFNGKPYELKYTVGGKLIVEKWLAQNGKKPLASQLAATIPYIPGNDGALVTNFMFQMEYLTYMLWSLLINKENKLELTMEKLEEMLFDMEPLSESELAKKCHDAVREANVEFGEILDTIQQKVKKKRPDSRVPSGKSGK